MKIPMSIILLPMFTFVRFCSFMFVFVLRSLIFSVDKISNAVCMFVNLCSILVCGSNSSAWFYILTKCTKEEKKANREKI